MAGQLLSDTTVYVADIAHGCSHCAAPFHAPAPVKPFIDMTEMGVGWVT